MDTFIQEMIAELYYRDITQNANDGLKGVRNYVLVVQAPDGEIIGWTDWSAAYKSLKHDVTVKRGLEEDIILSVICAQGAVAAVQERIVRRGGTLGDVRCYLPGGRPLMEVFYHLPIPELAREDIYAYINGGEYYCEDCCVAEVFCGDRLQFVEAINNDNFVAPDGSALDLIHENTFQFQQWEGQLIPLEGIFCSVCETELYAPVEEFEDEK